MSTLALQDIQALIPHREPILLVDRVVAWQKHDAIHAQRFFAEDDPAFKGHFPNQPILPGVLGVESMAQAAAILVNLSTNKKATETLFLFRSIDGVKFRQQIVPKNRIDIHVNECKSRNGLYFFEGKILVDGTLCTQATFTAKHVIV